MPRIVRVHGADPSVLIAGGVLWLASVPAFGLAAVTVLYPFTFYGDCFERCAAPVALQEAVGRPVAIWLAATIGLIALGLATNRWPQIGYPAFAILGSAILLGIVAVAASGELIAGLILLGWPGWSAIAFVNAAWRAKLPAPTSAGVIQMGERAR